MKQYSEYIQTIAKKWKLLSKEEEEALIARERHDEEHLRDLLFYHNMRAALNYSKMYAGGRLNSGDDVAQNALLGLFDASRNYDLDSGVKFITYATWRIIRSITYPTRLASYRVDSRMRYMDDLVTTSVDDQDDYTMEDILSSVAAPGYDPIEKQKSPAARIEQECGVVSLVKDVVDGLDVTDKKKSIFKEYVSQVMDDWKVGSYIPKSVGEKYGMTRQAAEQNIKCITRNVRCGLLNKHGNEEEIKALRRTGQPAPLVGRCRRFRLRMNRGLVLDYERLANCTDVTTGSKKRGNDDLVSVFYPESRNCYLHRLFWSERRKMEIRMRRIATCA